ncbi:helix-turn-helix domain-containing protein [Prevotella lacticifex]|uniref:Transcriptional regulator n=1 Tax=Prevotella lacticifex TaxID=2854755 RepID=A0A9R1C7Z0_9BACT|nr:AraC family transcriptional regulator [Prevotella lacticifex]MDD6866260.1 AraC family transcriptional regulator [Prevotella sp.]GJG37411.1 transcriptional regulator [Prevotella lacticifex]GJG40089.1 transcriptional regulator [Prevotella lacticifex]GJG43785.1 transcriptional regulator [Prevotella lacticifex]GJG47564.1 transcriptional regulator [Prevotella lacticifex]
MKGIETIDAADIKNRISGDQVSRNQDYRNVVGQHFILVRQSEIVKKQIIIGQPMRLAEWRLLHILAGRASYRINLVDHPLQGNEILVLPSDTVVEVQSLSEDFAAEALTVIDFPGVDSNGTGRLLPKEMLHLLLDTTNSKRFGTYFDLLYEQMTRAKVCDTAVSLLFLAMVADASSLNKTMYDGNNSRQSRGEEIMARFIHLLRQYGTTQRNIPFYAEQLHITPNHLSDVVRQQSGLSVMDWIHRTTTTEAKLLLKHSDMMICELSERLNFPEPTAFNRYFKKQTGVTPLAYRNSL